MKQFNVSKEYNKKKYTKKHLIFSLLVLIAFTILGISFAYFEVNYNTVIINSLVDSPINLNVYVSGVKSTEFPVANSNYHFDRFVCDGVTTAVWNQSNWSLDMSFSGNDDCSIYFFKKYIETELNGNDPLLDSKMLPIVLESDGTIKVADLEEEWYNYVNSEWANAIVLSNTSYLNSPPGTVIPMSAVGQMYVWIPRFRYDVSSIVNSANAIDVYFVDKNTTAHSAFTFGTDKLSGFWVGKFEQGANTKNIPNVAPVVNLNHYGLFTEVQEAKTLYSLDSTTDVHMIKNIEWGAIAYLSQSKYGVCNDNGTCSLKVENNSYHNTNLDTITGCGGSDTSVLVNASGLSICPSTYRWNTTNGAKASTTRNVYGVYDMAGGKYDAVMANMKSTSGTFVNSYAAFPTVPASKYYDSYNYSSNMYEYSRGIAGDATTEMSPANRITWNGDSAGFVGGEYHWMYRGSTANLGTEAGVFAFNSYFGIAYGMYATRSVAAVY